MKSILKAISIVVLLILVLLTLHLSGDQEVLFESLESKTLDGTAVFNKIRFFQTGGKDIWMMNQSHHGSTPGAEDWDRLAVVIDKTKSPQVARFYQFEPGPLEWRDDLVHRPFRVSCFMCHNNGPRVIRPNYASLFDPTSFSDKLKIMSWNLRIKLYGRILNDSEQSNEDKTPPFRIRGAHANESLKVATCAKCHKESGFLARGRLTRQQTPTIRFMISTGQMPPIGFWMSTKEKRELDVFLKGF